MNSRRHNALSLILFIVVPILLFQFQNCAPSHVSASSAAAGGGIDTVPEGKAQLQFVTPTVQVQDDTAGTDIDGFCDANHSGSALQWTLADQSGAVILSGTSECQGGQFVVNLVGLNELVCGVDEVLTVQGSWGASNSSTLTRRCQPVASMNVATPANSPEGTSCDVEYSPGSEADQQCTQVCYRDSKVVLSLSLDLNQCSSLAAGLAGP